MADTSGQTFEMPRKSSLVADLFTTQAQRDENKQERVIEMPLSLIDSFPNHPFEVRMDAEMQTVAASVEKYGVLQPGILRPKEDGRYEMVAGHRRKYASELANRDTMPVLVRNMTRDEATIIMVDSNLQREKILPSEKAKAYRMKLDAMKRQGQRTDLTSAPLGQKLDSKTSREIVAEKSSDSPSQIQRYVCLNNLIPPIMQMVDDGKIAMRPAVELSYLPPEQQETLHEAIVTEDCTPSHVQAMKMRKFSDEGRLSGDVILSIVQEEKPNQAEVFKMPREKLKKYFSPGTSAQKMEEIIIKALELWRKREQNRDAR